MEKKKTKNNIIKRQISKQLKVYKHTLVQGLLEEELSGVVQGIYLDCVPVLLKAKLLLADVAHAPVKTCNPCIHAIYMHLLRRSNGKGCLMMVKLKERVQRAWIWGKKLQISALLPMCK